MPKLRASPSYPAHWPTILTLALVTVVCQEGMWTRVLSRAMFLASELARVDVATSILSLLTKSKHLRPGAK